MFTLIQKAVPIQSYSVTTLLM